MSLAKAIFDDGPEYLIQADSIDYKKYPEIGHHLLGNGQTMNVAADSEVAFRLSPKEERTAFTFQDENAHIFKIISGKEEYKIKYLGCHVDSVTNTIIVYGLAV